MPVSFWLSGTPMKGTGWLFWLDQTATPTQTCPALSESVGICCIFRAGATSIPVSSHSSAGNRRPHQRPKAHCQLDNENVQARDVNGVFAGLRGRRLAASPERSSPSCGQKATPRAESGEERAVESTCARTSQHAVTPTGVNSAYADKRALIEYMKVLSKPDSLQWRCRADAPNSGRHFATAPRVFVGLARTDPLHTRWMILLWRRRIHRVRDPKSGAGSGDHMSRLPVATPHCQRDRGFRRTSCTR